MEKVKLLISDGMAKEGLQILEDSGLFHISLHQQLEKTKLKEILSEYEAIVVRSATKLDPEILSFGKNLKLIMRAGTGVDNIDVKKASQMGILVFNTPGANNNAVVELSIGFLFSLLRKIPQATSSIKAGNWEKKSFLGTEAEGRTIGVLGLGAIGSSVAKKADLLGMKVCAYDVNASKMHVDSFVQLLPTMEKVFKTASIVTVHIPLMRSTRNLIGKEQFSKMRKGSFFINCSRGGIVLEKDLLEALETGLLAGAAMDVFSTEPLEANYRLALHPNFICSPHIAAATKESQKNVALSAANSLIRYFRNSDTNFALNKHELQ